MPQLILWSSILPRYTSSALDFLRCERIKLKESSVDISDTVVFTRKYSDTNQ
jgi:hypothetical protein